MSSTTKDVQDVQTDELIKQLLALLKGRQAHADFDAAVKDFPAHLQIGRAHV